MATLFLAVLGLHCRTQAFSSCGEWRLLFVAVCGFIIVVASFVAEHRFYGAWALVVTLHTRDYFHSIYHVPLVYISVLMPVPNCFDYFIFVVFEVTKCESSVLLFSKIDLDIWSSLRIHINFRIFFYFSKKVMELLKEIALKWKII